MESIESGDGVFTNQAIQYESLPFEFFMNALRLLDGVPMSLFQKRTLVPIMEVKPKLMSLVDRGLLTVSKDVIRTTPLGLRFLNEVLQDFL
jgi:oxygen-independent coproporphyrinogen-3 oxidase